MMRCPACKTAVSLLDICMANHDETNGLQITFECPECAKVYFAILTPRTFVEAA